jgi:hypothetical protein
VSGVSGAALAPPRAAAGTRVFLFLPSSPRPSPTLSQPS